MIQADVPVLKMVIKQSSDQVSASFSGFLPQNEEQHVSEGPH